GQVEEARPLGGPAHGLEQEVAQEEAQVHRRVADVGRLVIDQREAVPVREDVLGAVVAVAEGVVGGEQAVDDGADGGGDLGPGVGRGRGGGVGVRGPEGGAVARGARGGGAGRGRRGARAGGRGGGGPRARPSLPGGGLSLPALRPGRGVGFGTAPPAPLFTD